MDPDTPQSLVSDQSREKANLKAYSCLLCRERKVKCDRRNPCSHCVKLNRQCSFVAPVRGKRTRTKPARETLHARLRRYEDLLRSFGVNIECSVDQDSCEPFVLSPPETVRNDEVESVRNQFDIYRLEDTTPKLVTKEGSSRYFDSGLWSNLGDDFEHPENQSAGESTDDLDEDEGELLIQSVSARQPAHLIDLKLGPEVLTALKHTYVDRVDPLVKILHLPTFWSALAEAQSDPQNVPKSLQALILAFYLIAITSLEEEESQNMFGLQKSIVVTRYRSAVRKALTNAGFLSTSSPTTLCAFCLFLMCCYSDNDRGEKIYVLSGVALRLARKMGLHRDGSSMGLTVFETEMRRRLWWQVAMVDLRTADIQGTRPSLDIFSADTKVPLNIEDDDLQPEAQVPPPERHAILPITFTLIRCSICETLRDFALESQGTLRFEIMSSTDISVERKETVINDLESRLEQRFLRYYDPSNPLHTFASIMIRSGLCKMRLFAYGLNCEVMTNDATKQKTESYKEKAFANALKLLEYVIFLRADAILSRKFTWQIGASYLWTTMLFTLAGMKYRKTGSDVDKAWQLIRNVFSHFPEIFQPSFKSALTPLSKWTLEVWDVYTAASMAQNLEQPSTPEFIIALRQWQSTTKKPQTKVKASDTSDNANAQSIFGYGTSESTKMGHQNPELASFDPYNFQSMEIDPNDWQWDQFFAEPAHFKL